MTNLVEGTTGIGTNVLILSKAAVRSMYGQDTLTFAVGDTMVLELAAIAMRDVTRPNLGYAINTTGGNLIYSVGVLNLGVKLDDVRRGEECKAVFHVELHLKPGKYLLSVSASDNFSAKTADSGVIHDMRERIAEIEVIAGARSAMLDGIGALPVTVTHWVI